MKAICYNAEQWFKSTRAKTRIMSHLDFNGVQFDPLKSAKNKRGDKICPTSWKNSHTCPEKNQPAVMPGPWKNAARETVDPLYLNEIEGTHVPDPTPQDPAKMKISQRSGRYYTCEEFPPRR